MTGRTIHDLAVGDVAEMAFPVTHDVVREFVEAAGDDNPIHSDPAFAATTRFRRIIAPGMLTASFVSAVIGTRLPGPGTIYLSQSLRFVRPVFVGDRVTARVEVTERLVERNRMRLETKCTNEAGEIVLEGEAWVLPSPTPIEYEGPAPDRSPWRDGRRPAEPFSHLVWGPAALPLRLASVWMEGALNLAGHSLRFWLPATPAAAETRRP